MTRSTRSAASQQQQNDREKSQPDTPRKAAGAKKRKRTSFVDNAEQPASKVVRTQDGVKEEGSPEPADEQAGETVTTVDLPSSGDVPLSTEDAEQILDVLEMADTQGLLDRIFPLPTEHTSASESEAGPSTGTQSYSFRALLKSPANYPLRVLRTAVKHLFPISTHSRSRPSAPAAEQIRFCQLALSLLDQASCHQAPVPLDLPSLIPPSRSSADTSGNPGVRGQRKYALVQHLPTGDWWSSLNSTHSSQHDGKDLKDLPTAYAELVAILPSASASDPPADSLTLGQYVKKRTFKQLHVPQQRVIPCGSFLDYGPYATFAPTFEQNGVEIGRERLSEVVWYKEQDRRRRARVRAYREQLAAKAAQRSTEEPEIEEVEKAGIVKQKEKLKEEDVDALEGLLTPEQITNIKGALDSLELENAVSELLERNTRALARLEELQLERLSQGPKDVEVGSEEWETAQNILDSLTLLASLRPRSTAHGDSAPLIPPASTLRKLHRTLPMESTQGWYGTLSDSRQVACSDDNTVRIRTGAPPPVPAPAPAPSPAPTPVTATAATTPAATPSKPAAPSYSNYQYSSSYPTPYRGGYGTNYYPNYQASATPSSSTNHYPNHQYATSGQQPYSAYSSWYNYQPPGQNTATAAAGSGSGPSTPAPAKATVPAGYSGYFTNPNANASVGTPQQPTPQRAVANTVLSSAGRGWTNGSGTAYVAPTIPPHMRGAGVVSRGGGGGSGSAPGTPQPQPATTGAGGYYIGYQQQVQQARS